MTVSRIILKPQMHSRPFCSEICQ